MEIPKRFKIANTEYEVQVVDKSDDGNYGYHNDIRRKIVVAKSMDDEGKIVQLTEQQIENTFWHELFHCFQLLQASLCFVHPLLWQVLWHTLYQYHPLWD